MGIILQRSSGGSNSAAVDIEQTPICYTVPPLLTVNQGLLVITRNAATGVEISRNIQDFAGAVVAGAVAQACTAGKDYELVENCLEVTVAGAWGAIGDKISELRFFDTSVSPAVQSSVLYINQATQAFVLGVDATNTKACVQSSDKIEILCLCDDTLNDGSVVVQFKRIVSISPAGVVTVLANLNQALSAPYVPVGTVKGCSEVISPIVVTQERVILNGAGTFTVAVGTLGYEAKVISGNGATFTDTEGVTSALFQGESFGHDASEQYPLKTGAIITSVVGTVVAIDFEKLV